jgi:hypothetical protein
MREIERGPLRRTNRSNRLIHVNDLIPRLEFVDEFDLPACLNKWNVIKTKDVDVIRLCAEGHVWRSDEREQFLLNRFHP